jgi:prevent-host-death family protein
MARVTASKARDGFPELINKVAYGGERIIVARRGRDVAVIIPIQDLRLLERLSHLEQARQDGALTEAGPLPRLVDGTP